MTLAEQAVIKEKARICYMIEEYNKRLSNLPKASIAKQTLQSGKEYYYLKFREEDRIVVHGKIKMQKQHFLLDYSGFYSKVNLSFLMQENLKFILPLQSNTTLIDEAFEKNPDDRKFDGRFVFKDRLIWFKKNSTGNLGNYVYLFRDDQRKSAAEVRFQNELDSNWGEEEITETDFFADTRRGLYAFVSNIDEKPSEIYMKYKERWDIEQCFDYLKNSVCIGASYRRTNQQLEAWSFINHISLLYFYGIVRALREKKLNKDYTADDIIAIGRNIYRVNTDNSFRVSEISKNDQAILDSLGVDLLRKN